MNDWPTLADTARTYGIHAQTLHTARLTGRLIAHRIGEGRRAIYILEPDSLHEFLKTYRPRRRTQAEAPAAETTTAPAT